MISGKGALLLDFNLRLPAFAVLLGALVALAGCGETSGSRDTPEQVHVLLATTTSTQDSGLLDELLPLFEAQTGYQVKTIAVGEDFSLFGSRMGLADVSGLTFPSPYPIHENGLIYLPEGMPQPSDPGHTDAMLEAVTPLLDMSTGGVFCLSYPPG